MLSKLHEVVRDEADMLSIFTPSQFEYSFDKEGVTYAGRALGGRITESTRQRMPVSGSASW